MVSSKRLYRSILIFIAAALLYITTDTLSPRETAILICLIAIGLIEPIAFFCEIIQKKNA